ncbi:MAG: ABC transporter permease [Desulfobacterales bacterium]|nr:ABC transporter permease [Desulfobacterales bacterium]
MDPVVYEKLIAKFGLDKPLHVQYLIWMGRFLRGDLGFSFVNNQPVATQIVMRAKLTAELMLGSLFLSLSLAIPLGVVSAVKHNSIFDNIFTILSTIGYCMPRFWMGLLFIYFFAVSLGWLPTFGVSTLGVKFNFFEGLLDHLKHLVLPMVTCMFNYLAYYFRMVRASMLEVLHEQYLTTARVKGVKEQMVIYKHALRNALLPVTTALGMSMGFILAGSVVIETVFAWPGLGSYLVVTTIQRDYAGILGISMLIVTMVLVTNLISDIAIALIDPRIKY